MKFCPEYINDPTSSACTCRARKHKNYHDPDCILTKAPAAYNQYSRCYLYNYCAYAIINHRKNTSICKLTGQAISCSKLYGMQCFERKRFIHCEHRKNKYNPKTTEQETQP